MKGLSFLQFLSTAGAKEFTFAGAISAIGTTFTLLLGGWDHLVEILVWLLIADYATGFFAALKEKRLNSDVMFWGGVRKGAVLIVIMLAIKFDVVVGNTQPIFRTLALYYYIAREGLSVFENFGLLGVKYPDFIMQVLSQLQERAKGTNVKDKEEK